MYDTPCSLNIGNPAITLSGILRLTFFLCQPGNIIAGPGERKQLTEARKWTFNGHPRSRSGTLCLHQPSPSLVYAPTSYWCIHFSQASRAAAELRAHSDHTRFSEDINRQLQVPCNSYVFPAYSLRISFVLHEYFFRIRFLVFPDP